MNCGANFWKWRNFCKIIKYISLQIVNVMVPPPSCGLAGCPWHLGLPCRRGFYGHSKQTGKKLNDIEMRQSENCVAFSHWRINTHYGTLLQICFNTPNVILNLFRILALENLLRVFRPHVSAPSLGRTEKLSPKVFHGCCWLFVAGCCCSGLLLAAVLQVVARW